MKYIFSFSFHIYSFKYIYFIFHISLYISYINETYKKIRRNIIGINTWWVLIFPSQMESSHNPLSIG